MLTSHETCCPTNCTQEKHIPINLCNAGVILCVALYAFAWKSFSKQTKVCVCNNCMTDSRWEYFCVMAGASFHISIHIHTCCRVSSWSKICLGLSQYVNIWSTSCINIWSNRASISGPSCFACLPSFCNVLGACLNHRESVNGDPQIVFSKNCQDAWKRFSKRKCYFRSCFFVLEKEEHLRKNNKKGQLQKMHRKIVCFSGGKSGFCKQWLLRK